MDRFTKIVRLKATTMNVSSEEITKIYWNEIWKLHEVPKKFLNNGELQFALKFIGEFMKALETMRQLSTAYHSQTDRQTERLNQKVGIFLWHYVNYQQNDWMKWLAAAEFSYNDKKHATTGQTLFKLNFGRHTWKGNLMMQTEFPKLEEFLTGLQRSWEEATKKLQSQ